MAEAYLRKLCADARIDNITVSSAGTCTDDGLPASAHAVETMRRTGIDISGHRSSRIHPETVEKADLILAMARMHKEWLLSLFPEYAPKTRLLLEYADRPGEDISDPAGGGEALYRSCFAEIKTAVDNLFLELKSASAKNKKSRAKPRRRKGR